jgi:hypothetical protein
MSRRSSTSTPAVGSSKNKIFGSCASALAISTRRFMPPDSCMIVVSFLSQSDKSRSTFSRCASFGGLPNRPRLNRTVAQTLSNASVASSCGTRPILERAARNSLMMSWPSARTTPELGRTMPQMMLINVVLPAPFGPSSAKISPRRISRSTLFNASKPEAYVLVRPATEMIGSAGWVLATFMTGRSI